VAALSWSLKQPMKKIDFFTQQEEIVGSKMGVYGEGVAVPVWGPR